MYSKESLIDEMKQYAQDMISGKEPVNEMRKLAAERFLKDLDNPAYTINIDNVITVIFLIEQTFVHIKGPARRKPYILEKWQKWIIFNLVGFELTEHPGERRFKEAFIFIPRKNSKTFFASALAWALIMLEKNAYAVLYIVATKLDRAREAFDNIKENIELMGERKNFDIRDNNAEHSISRKFYSGKEQTGAIKIQALAADSKRADGLNANIIILDEIHGYKSSNDYYVYKQAMKAYVNKLLIGITTAGAEMNSFCYERLQYCKNVLKGEAKDEQYFIFICEADDPDDYTNPYQHRIANPNYGVTIRPDDIENEALQAQNDSSGRAEFLNKSLNIYVNALDSYFNIFEFRDSDSKYDWTLEELSKLPIKWYGGADLSLMHDLTAACLYGQYEGVDICISHAFFPKEEAIRKAQEDHIPLFGWEEDGWLTMCNAPTVQYEDVIKWFASMRDMGFKIVKTGYDRRFAREFIELMKKNRFKLSDTPQYTYVKSQAFRHIERKVKNHEFYYLHSQAYEYCVENVKAVEDTEETVRFMKIAEKRRIDLFDASSMACFEMLESIAKTRKAIEWLDSDD